jgi:hypothetical protein
MVRQKVSEKMINLLKMPYMENLPFAFPKNVQVFSSLAEISVEIQKRGMSYMTWHAEDDIHKYWAYRSNYANYPMYERHAITMRANEEFQAAIKNWKGRGGHYTTVSLGHCLLRDWLFYYAAIASDERGWYYNHAILRMAVWNAGYGVYGMWDGKLWVYKAHV